MVELAAILACLSQGIDAALVLAVIDQESSRNPVALNINGWDSAPVVPETPEEAAIAARVVLEAGYSVDTGLMGINSSNLERLGVPVEDSFTPCTSIALGEHILAENLAQAGTLGHRDQAALVTALSLYNTGSATRGIENGYVAKVLARLDGAHAELAAAGASTVAIDDGPHDTAGPVLDRRSSVVAWVRQSKPDDAVRTQASANRPVPSVAHATHAVEGARSP